MGEWLSLHSARGDVRAWVARPEQAPRGAIVVIQEIFGLTAHIRDIADRFAAAGFTAMAPAFFDVFEPGIELAYDDAVMAYAFAEKLKVVSPHPSNGHPASVSRAALPENFLPSPVR